MRKLTEKLVEECTEHIEVKIAAMTLFEHRNECICSYTIFVPLAVIALAVNTGIGAYFVYSCRYLKKDVTLTQ